MPIISFTIALTSSLSYSRVKPFCPKLYRFQKFLVAVYKEMISLNSQTVSKEELVDGIVLNL